MAKKKEVKAAKKPAKAQKPCKCTDDGIRISVRAIQAFSDKCNDNKVRQVGEIFEVSLNREDEILSVGQFIERI